MEGHPLEVGVEQGQDRLGELGPALRRGLELIALRTLENPEEAREAVQEILARAVVAIRSNRIPSDASVPAFVHGIARHVLSDTKRLRHKEHGHVSAQNVPLAADQPSPLESLLGQEERDQLRRALTQLSRQDRELLTRHYVLGESMQQIAKQRQIPAERVRKRKSRALQRLRDLMGDRLGHVSPSPPMSVA